ncbi:TRAP transporter large permease [Sulfitobacter sp. F26204]|uniref:TRAP transporter large permease n=1 Tax=Sulfitobacter sp. F26204 TaxID=2996014 RepID=UPI00225E199D|nr:TRAP transporter large permease [Sulfitobacter sp. F26204]MCX7561727.1 TRAP transporter large permease [Sulfitobacter sp. F26204]
MIEWPIGAAIVFVLLLSGLPIAISLAIVGTLGTASIIGLDPALSLMGQTFFDNGRHYTLAVLPMFLLMGNLIAKSGIANELYNAAYSWLRHRKGGLAMATVVACGGFSSVCGSSLATAATMSRISMPAMRKYNYPDSLSTASIAAGGTLGILIPPSVILVFYGIMTQQDIGKLFIAGLVPGLIGILGYVVAVQLSIRMQGVDLLVEDRLPFRARIMSLKGAAGALMLFAFVMGGIYLGVFTPTESAGMGAFGALVLTLLSGKFSVSDLTETLFETAKTTTMMFFVLFGALTFSNYVNLSGMTQDLQAALTYLGTGPWSLMLTIVAIYLVLGCILEGLSMITLTVPIFYPIVASEGFDLIWFGIFVVVVTEVSYITPPVGMNAFAVRSAVPNVKLNTIFGGLVPFVLVDVVRILLLLAVPGLVLFLPSLM